MKKTVILCGLRRCCPVLTMDDGRFHIVDDFGNAEILTEAEARILSRMEGKQIAFRSLRMGGDHAAELQKYV